MTEKLIVLIHSVSRGEAEPTRLRSPAELRQLELRILHAARRRQKNRLDYRPSGQRRLDAGTHRRLGSRILFTCGEVLAAGLQVIFVSFLLGKKGFRGS